MAKNIKGITIEIGGNTTKLESALKNVNKSVYSLNNDLKSLNKALKLDPKNTELLAQKQDVLKQNIKATTDRLNTLKEAQRQMGSYNSLTDEQKESYRALSVEIAKSESALKGMKEELKNTSKINLDGLKEGLKKVGQVAANVAKKMLQVSAAVAGALAGVVAAGVKSYANLEQNIGGINKLFGKSADALIENAKNAYQTAGLSANQYMETATSFSASLLKSLSGNTKKAVGVTDRAIKDMSDNANTFGTSMDEVMNVYKALSKEQYTTLDNLRLGYAGTKTGMKALIHDASQYTDIQKKLNVSVKDGDMSFGNIINAISVMQKHLNITGTTANEAKDTITGSINSMKAAFDNFLNGSGTPEALAQTVTNVLTNVSNAIVKLAPGILSGIVKLVETLLPKVAKILIDLIPQLLDAVSNMIDSLLKMVTQDMSGVQKVITTLINKIVLFVTNNLPKIIELGIQLIVSLAQGIAESLPTLIPTIVDCILNIVDIFLDNIDTFIEVAIQIIVALIQGITEALPTLIQRIPEIIEKIVQVLIENLPLIIDAAIQIIFAIIQGLLEAIPDLAMMVPQIVIAIIKGLIQALPKYVENGGKIISSIIQGIGNNMLKLASKSKEIKETIIGKIKSLPKDMLNWGKDMILGLANGIKSAVSHVTDAVKGVATKIKNFLHFSRPDIGPLREYEEWMPDFMKGLAKGIRQSSYLVENATDKLADNMANKLSLSSLVNDTNKAMKNLNYGVNNSMNPMINPNAINVSNKMLAEQLKGTMQTNNSKEEAGFTAIINNNSKYTSPSENIRLLRQQYELYKLKYGGGR